MGRTQSSTMKTALRLLLLSVVGLALVFAELHGEDQYTEDANVVAVDDTAAMDYSADEMDDLKDEMEDSDSRRSKKSCPSGFTHYQAEFDKDEPIAAPTDGVGTSPESQTAQIKSFNKQTAQMSVIGQAAISASVYHHVSGTVTASTTSAGELKFEWDLAGLEASIDGLEAPGEEPSITGTPNPTADRGKNGIHIHYGDSCANIKGDAPFDITDPNDPVKNANAGHYYNPATSLLQSPIDLMYTVDPWADVKWNSDAEGKSTGSVTIPGFSSSKASLGADDFSAFGRVVIVHNSFGTKVACGVLAPSNTVMGNVRASVDPSLLGDSNSLGLLKFDWNLEGLDAYDEACETCTDETKGCTDGTCTDETKGCTKCELGGIHIHYGNSCDSEVTVKGDAPTGASKGHYYVPTDLNVVDSTEDPWSTDADIHQGPAVWKSDASGTATGSVTLTSAVLGVIAVDSALDRVVIVHNRNGKEIGCGLLSAERKTNAKGTFEMKICNDGSFARYKVDLTGDFADAKELNFRLQSAYTPDAAAGTVGGTGTGGQYDPGYKCGAHKCGDLSGKVGPVKVDWDNDKRITSGVNDWKHNKWSAKDTHPPLNADFSCAGDTTGATFASVVFHKGSTRLFGAKLVSTTPSKLKAIFHGTNLKGKVVVKQKRNRRGWQSKCNERETTADWAVNWKTVDIEKLCPVTQEATIQYFNDPDDDAGSPETVTGFVNAHVQDGKLKLNWKLQGLDDNSSGGIHIHYGTTCDTEATVKGNAPTGANLGHYYVPDATPDPSEDPWTTVMWKSYADGDAEDSAEFTEDQLGAAPDSAFNRVVIVHNRNGKKVACGVLAPFTHRLGVGRSLKWHIHDKWTHTDKTDAYGADDCGPAFTGGHWDPTFQCSSASDNSLEVCRTEYNKNPPAAGPAQYPCDETTGKGCNYSCKNWGGASVGCELGDLTGKGVGYGGRVMITTDGPQKGAGRGVRDTNCGNTEQFAGKSIVFHCGVDPARVACAKLN